MTRIELYQLSCVVMVNGKKFWEIDNLDGWKVAALILVDDAAPDRGLSDARAVVRLLNERAQERADLRDAVTPAERSALQEGTR